MKKICAILIIISIVFLYNAKIFSNNNFEKEKPINEFIKMLESNNYNEEKAEKYIANKNLNNELKKFLRKHKVLGISYSREIFKKDNVYIIRISGWMKYKNQNGIWSYNTDFTSNLTVNKNNKIIETRFFKDIKNAKIFIRLLPFLVLIFLFLSYLDAKKGRVKKIKGVIKGFGHIILIPSKNDETIDENEFLAWFLFILIGFIAVMLPFLIIKLLR